MGYVCLNISFQNKKYQYFVSSLDVCLKKSLVSLVTGDSVVVLSLFVVTSIVCVVFHTGKCIRRFGGIYAYCRYSIDRKW